MDWRPEHHGDRRYLRRWLALAFDLGVILLATVGFAAIVWLVVR